MEDENLFEDIQDWTVDGRIQWEMYRKHHGIELSADALRKRYERQMQRAAPQDEGDIHDAEELLRRIGFNPQNFKLDYYTSKSFKIKPRSPAETVGPERIEALFAQLENLPKATRATDPPKGKHGVGLMYMPSFCDLHFNKLCWARETGENYDVEIASQIFRDIVKLDLRRIGDRVFDLALIPFGNDLFNSDGLGTTTKGTPQEEDTRILKAFDRVVTLFVEAIDQILNYAKEVKVVLVQGNHDELLSSLGAYCLHTWYRNEPRVTVDISLRKRKYHLFGCNLIGLGHMDEDAKRIPLVLANEAKRYWGEARFVEFHGAHQHVSDTCVIGNVKMLRNPSITANDNYHERNAYMAPRQHISYLYDSVHGPSETWIYNVPERLVELG